MSCNKPDLRLPSKATVRTAGQTGGPTRGPIRLPPELALSVGVFRVDTRAPSCFPTSGATCLRRKSRYRRGRGFLARSQIETRLAPITSRAEPGREPEPTTAARE